MASFPPSWGEWKKHTYLQSWTIAAYLSPFHKHNGYVRFRGQFGQRSLKAPPVLCGTEAERGAGQALRSGAAAGTARQGRGFRVPNCTPPGDAHRRLPARQRHLPQPWQWLRPAIRLVSWTWYMGIESGNMAWRPATNARVPVGFIPLQVSLKLTRPTFPVNPEFRKTSEKET